MSTPGKDAALLEKIPGLTADVLRFERQRWTPQAPMRQIINELANSEVERRRNTLETCTPEELAKIQGEIAGIRSFLGKINEQSNS